MNTYLMDPSKRTTYEDEMQKQKDTLNKRTVNDLTREQVLSSCKHLEQSKLNAQMKMYEIVRAQRLAPHMINAIIKVEKLRADDMFYNETSIEEEDVEPSIERLKLEEDEEYKAIIEEWATKSKDFLASKADETAGMMAKAQEMAKQRAEQKAATPKITSGAVKVSVPEVEATTIEEATTKEEWMNESKRETQLVKSLSLWP